MRAIATICNRDYAGLLEYWLGALQKISDLPVFVFCIDGFSPSLPENAVQIMVDATTNPFPVNTPDHVCAEKLRLFEHLPPHITQVLFLDVDILVQHPFWKSEDYFSISEKMIVMCPDLFVGYKEKMESEFQPFDFSFKMKYNHDGSYFYFITGIFFASRTAHAEWFSKFLKTWTEYVKVIGKYPSIFDQNIFNYCLIKNNLPVYQMQTVNNCLRQYENQTVEGEELLLNGKIVNAYHFNGGDGLKKLKRWEEMLSKLYARA